MAAGFDARVIAIVDAAWGLTRSYGFGPARIDLDRAQVDATWTRPDGFAVRLGWYGVGRIENLGAGFSPPDPRMALSLAQLRAAVRPDAPTLDLAGDDEAAVRAWADEQAAWLREHLPSLLADPAATFERVREAEPLGPQCAAFVQRCRQELALEALGFSAPRAIHWRHRVEIVFARRGVRVLVQLEDHENAGVTAEPFTVPEITLHRDGQPPVALTELVAQLEPAHAGRRPVADRYAMALSAVTPWLRHDAAFLRRHPELLR